MKVNIYLNILLFSYSFLFKMILFLDFIILFVDLVIKLLFEPINSI
jgi:hypothetical protein